MSVLIKPIVTEKTTSETVENRYTFLVDPKANKVEIKKAVEATYGVTVDKVRTLIYGQSAEHAIQKPGFSTGKPMQPNVR